ncbi:MAG TPA: PQQ-binding-like beta-propeller repeat protein [Steroidobacteraceae bacterium]|nr:PQQ-binding-like beta-propeller repeat protein [Steroidobacteraceae bacterium]
MRSGNLSGGLLRAALLALAACTAMGTAAAQTLFAGGPVKFTAEQARRGQQVYTESCAQCHGRHLVDGQFGPPVKGPAFTALWHDQSPDALWSVLFRRMPPASPGSLDSGAYTDVEAYLLEQNGERAGPVPLTTSLVSVPATLAAPAGVAAPEHAAVARLDNEDATYHAAMAAHRALLDKLTPVTDAMLRTPPAADWLMWRGTYATQAYSPLAQINRNTVRSLTVAWSLALPVSANEAAPLIHDGVLFIESANTVEAVDATDGTLLWQYLRVLPPALHGGREARMKGMALYAGELYAPTADGHIVALDAKTGALRWDRAVVTPEQGVQPGLVDGAWFHISGGPLVAHGKVVVGVSLGIETGGGDYIVGLDARTGNEEWRFNTIARPGEPGGDSWNGAPVKERFGSGVWSIGSYDPDLNLVYFGTGNTYDVGTLLMPRAGRKLADNDALYTDSTVALDADTGRLAWYYQHMNRDVWDLDWAFEQSLVTVPIEGVPTRLLVTGGKLAIFDAVNRADGHYAFSQDMGVQNLVGKIDPKSGRKLIRPELEPQAGRTDLICPTATGARSWPTTAIDPATDYLYVPLLDNNCMNYTWTERDAAAVAGGGQDMRLSARPKPGNDGNFGRIDAIDLKTRKVVWSKPERAPIASSLLASAGGLVFGGARDRHFRAYDAATGQVLWESVLNASPSSSPATYSVDGVQYLVVIAGGGGALDSGSRNLTPEIIDPPAGTTVWVFRLAAPAPVHP